jgi:N-ethylmaleimide reductase
MILCGGYNKKSAEEDIQNGLCDLVGFGRPFINNPDLVERLKNNLDLSQDLKTDLFYTAEAKGYTDYPVFKIPMVTLV